MSFPSPSHLLCVTLLSVTLDALAESQVPPITPVKEPWRVEVAPYIWAMNMHGTVQVGGARIKIDQSFSDILRELNWAGMVWVDAYKGNWDIFLNAIYAELSDDKKDGLVTAKLNNQFGILSVGASYQAYRYCIANTCNASSIALEPYAGLRYTVNDTQVKISVLDYTLKAKNDQHWIDPILGGRLRYTINAAWMTLIGADVGGINTSNQYSYNIYGLIGYHPQTHWTNTSIYLGYRLLDQLYQHGHGENFYRWDMKLFGPLLGIAIEF